MDNAVLIVLIPAVAGILTTLITAYVQFRIIEAQINAAHETEATKDDAKAKPTEASTKRKRPRKQNNIKKDVRQINWWITGGITLIVVLIVGAGSWNFLSPPLPSAKRLALIEAFYVEINGVRKRVKPGDEITVTLNSVLIIEPQFSESPPDLTLTWKTCQAKSKIDPLDASPLRVSYTANVQGADCVRLFIETGGLFEDGSFSLNVH